MAKSVGDAVYFDTREGFGALLRQAFLSAALIRPTGILTALQGSLTLVKRGILPLIGDGNDRTELLEFFSYAVTDECIAPVLGSRRLDGFWPDC